MDGPDPSIHTHKPRTLATHPDSTKFPSCCPWWRKRHFLTTPPLRARTPADAARASATPPTHARHSHWTGARPSMRAHSSTPHAGCAIRCCLHQPVSHPRSRSHPHTASPHCRMRENTPPLNTRTSTLSVYASGRGRKSSEGGCTPHAMHSRTACAVVSTRCVSACASSSHLRCVALPTCAHSGCPMLPPP